MSIEAMKQALEEIRQAKLQGRALERNEMLDDASKLISQAIAEAEKQEQGEPVGEVILYTGEGFPCAPFHKVKWSDGMMPPIGTKFYTKPQQLKPLTDEQIDFVYKTANPFVPRENVIQIARAIEAAHGIKE
jgi:hypothetical protein